MTLDNERNWRPRVDALKGTASYTALASVYILTSTGLAAKFATNTEELEHVEVWKGIGFVVVTAAILFVVLRSHEARIREQAAALARRDEHLATAGRRDLRVLEAATIAHDLNNALTVLDAEVRELIETPAPRPSDDMDQTLDQLRSLARGLGDTLHDRVAPDLEELDFGELATRVARLVRAHVEARHCRIEVCTDDRARTFGAPREATQILLNLVLNAAQATGPDGHVRVSCSREDGTVVILVDDDGPGVSPDRRTHVFEPGVSTKPTGCGLGLVAVQNGVRRFGGAVTIEESPLGGARFRVTLPVRSSVAATAGTSGDRA